MRLWHWLNALAVLGSLSTVLLRKTFLSWRTNSELIEAHIRELGGTIATEDAVALAKAIRAPMWEWHYVFGSALIGFLALRLVIGLVDPAQAPLRTTWRALTRVSRASGAQKRSETHFLLVEVSYVVFYGMLTFMALSGSSLYFGDALGLSEGLTARIKDAHELAMWFFVFFVPAHIGGVVVAELRGERGLVSDMIHGGEPRA